MERICVPELPLKKNTQKSNLIGFAQQEEIYFHYVAETFVLATRTFVFLNPNELPSMSFFNVQVLDHI